MNKKSYAQNILQLVDNCREIDGMSDEEVVENLIGFLNPLEPVDRPRFAQWGLEEDQCSMEECWK